MCIVNRARYIKLFSNNLVVEVAMQLFVKKAFVRIRLCFSNSQKSEMVVVTRLSFIFLVNKKEILCCYDGSEN